MATKTVLFTFQNSHDHKQSRGTTGTKQPPPTELTEASLALNRIDLCFFDGGWLHTISLAELVHAARRV